MESFVTLVLPLSLLDDKNPCHLDEAPGPCRGLLTRYFFDSGSQQCKHFFYGGCFGNANNFRSMAACQAKCQNPGRPGWTFVLLQQRLANTQAVQTAALLGSFQKHLLSLAGYCVQQLWMLQRCRHLLENGLYLKKNMRLYKSQHIYTSALQVSCTWTTLFNLAKQKWLFQPLPQNSMQGVLHILLGSYHSCCTTCKLIPEWWHNQNSSTSEN